MRGRNSTSAWVKFITILGIIGVLMGVAAALPYLPGAIGAFTQHFQEPTGDTLVTSVKYVVAIVIAFAVPTTILGIFIAVVTGQADV